MLSRVGWRSMRSGLDLLRATLYVLAPLLHVDKQIRSGWLGLAVFDVTPLYTKRCTSRFFRPSPAPGSARI